MERTAQEKRKKFMVIIPMIIAGLIIGSLIFTQSSFDSSNAKTITDGQTPLAGPGAGSTANTQTVPAPVTGTAGGIIITNGAALDNDAAERAAQLEANLREAQSRLDTAKAELEKAKADSELTAKQLADAEQKVKDALKLQNIYMAAKAMTEVVNQANARNDVMILHSGGTYKSLKNYFAGSNEWSLNSTGFNYATGFNGYVKDNKGVDVSGYFYRAENKNGVVTVFITENNGTVYKYIADGTLTEGTADTKIKGGASDASNPQHNVIDSNTFEGTGAVYTEAQINEDKTTADQALEAARTDKSAADAAQFAAQTEADDAQTALDELSGR